MVRVKAIERVADCVRVERTRAHGPPDSEAQASPVPAARGARPARLDASSRLRSPNA